MWMNLHVCWPCIQMLLKMVSGTRHLLYVLCVKCMPFSYDYLTKCISLCACVRTCMWAEECLHFWFWGSRDAFSVCISSYPPLSSSCAHIFFSRPYTYPSENIKHALTRTWILYAHAPVRIRLMSPGDKGNAIPYTLQFKQGKTTCWR